MLLRIGSGVAESGVDYQPGDAFPHDVLLDETWRRRLQEGLLCRPGGGVAHAASRHRPAPRADRCRPRAPCPRRGTEITADGRPVGHARHGAGGKRAGDRPHRPGQGRARRRRSRSLAGDVPVTLAIPAWAKFTLSQEGRRRGGGLMPDRPALRRAPGSACCPAAGSTCSTPRRSTSRSPTSRMGWPASPAGTARPSATTPFRSRSIRCWSKRSFGVLDAGRRRPCSGWPRCCTTRPNM